MTKVTKKGIKMLKCCYLNLVSGIKVDMLKGNN